MVMGDEYEMILLYSGHFDTCLELCWYCLRERIDLSTPTVLLQYYLLCLLSQVPIVQSKTTRTDAEPPNLWRTKPEKRMAQPEKCRAHGEHLGRRFDST
jgi:hypothetical protein